MTKIKQVSCILRILFQIGFALIPILLLAGWVLGPNIYFGTHQFGVGMTAYPRDITLMQPITISTRLCGLLVSLLPTAIEMYLLYCLIQLFSCYERLEIFSLKTVRLIRNIGLALLAQVVVEFVYIILINLVLNGSKTQSMNFSSVNVSMVIWAVLIIINSWFMQEGYQLHQEQQLTI